MTYIIKLEDDYGRKFFESDTLDEANEFMDKVSTEHKENDEFFGRTEPSLRCLKLFTEE